MKRSVIIDKTAPDIVKDQLRDLGYSVVDTVKLDTFETSLGTHPDIQVCKIRQYLVVDPRTYEYYLEELKDTGITVVKGKVTVTNYYPDNIAYNVAVLDDYAIHNFNYTDPVIQGIIDKLGLIKVDVKQGYSKCNILHTEDSIITSDEGIVNRLPSELSRLKISPDSIVLRGYDYGFIGGATGYDSRVVYFLGDILAHPEYKKIKEYLDSKNIDTMVLGNDSLTDLGSLIFI